MKKMISLLLSIALILSLTACGSDTAKITEKPTEETTEETTVETTEETTEETTAAPVKDVELGELHFDLPEGAEILMEFEGGYKISLVPKETWAVLCATDVSDMERDMVSGVMAGQHDSLAEPDKDHYSETEMTLTVAESDVDFDLFATEKNNGDLRCHMIGTFTDTWYAYALYMYTDNPDNDGTTRWGALLDSATHSGKEPRYDRTESADYSTTQDETINTSDKKYDAGMYKVGSDVPAGEYLFIGNSSSAAYVCISSDSNQDDIIENENFDYSFFATISDGQYVQAKRCYFVPADSRTLEINEDGSFGEGMYRVGIDIPAGEYKLTATSDRMGYYCIYNDSIVPFDIENNDNFEGSSYVTVSDGQYLTLSRCTATPE